MGGVAKNLKRMKERTELGPCPIETSFLNGLSEEQYRQQYNNDYTLGIVYALHKFTPKEKLSYKGISKRIGWGWRTVKNGLWGIRERGLLKTSIQRVEYNFFDADRTKIRFYLNNPQLSQLDYKTLINSFCNGKSCNTPMLPNKAEQAMLDVLNDLYNNQFRFSGGRCCANKVGNIYPDTQHLTYPIVLDHFGSHIHTEEEEVERIKNLNGQGYYAHVVWDFKKEDYNKIIKMKEFVDNAIQDFQQLVI